MKVGETFILLRERNKEWGWLFGERRSNVKLRHKKLDFLVSQSAITCSKLKIGTLE